MLRTSIFQAILAVTTVAATTAVLYLMQGQLTTPIVALLYLLPVLASTTRWGLGPGITAAVCSFLTFNFFFIPPYYTFIVHQTQDVIVLFVFLVVAVVISQLIGRVKSSLASAQAREREVIHLYNLSTELGGTHHLEEVGKILVTKIWDILAPAAVQLRLLPAVKGQPVAIQRPAGDLPARAPEHVIPLAATRGPLGELRLWERDRPLNEAESRLLHALIGQVAVALERSALEEAETRATILEESDRIKSALLSSVSHELRTPLVTIKAAATSLRSGMVSLESEASDDLLAALEEEAERLNQFVGDLLNMSRIEAGALKLERQWNILAEIVDTATTRLKDSLAGYHLYVDVPEDLPLVPVDHVLLQQVFVNLLSNCLKYAPEGTAIHIAAKEQQEDPPHLLIQVTNEGPPVPDEHLEHIFDKFHRVTAAERVPGTGLGLSICQGVVEAHGGRIWAENLPVGFAFKFTLPLTWEGMSGPRMPADSEQL